MTKKIGNMFPLAVNMVNELIETGHKRYPKDDFFERHTQGKLITKAEEHIIDYQRGSRYDVVMRGIEPTHNLASAIFDLLAAYEYELRALSYGKHLHPNMSDDINVVFGHKPEADNE